MIDQFRAILARLRAEDAAMTPGPWEALPPGSKKWVTNAISSDDDWRVNRDSDAMAVAAQRNRNARLLDLLEAASELLTKLDEVHENETYKSVWFVNQLHTGPYTGPTYTEEFEKLRTTIREFVEAEQEVPRG